MQPNDVTWAIVVLAAVQAVHAMGTALFAWFESDCRHNLAMLRLEVAHLRQSMSHEGQANRQAIEGISRRIDDGGREQPPPAV